jgi:hypothetical protein
MGWDKVIIGRGRLDFKILFGVFSFLDRYWDLSGSLSL